MVKVEFFVKSETDQIKSILDMLKTKDEKISLVDYCVGKQNPFAQRVIDFFGIDVASLEGKLPEEKEEIIAGIVRVVYKKELPNMKDKAVDFQQHWDNNEQLINNEFTEIFNRDMPSKICRSEVSINPCCPRNLQGWSFDVFSEKTKEQGIHTAAHEITHFLWREKVKQLFPNLDEKLLEAPNDHWRLSEIAIAPIFNNSKLKNLSSDTKAGYVPFFNKTQQEKEQIAEHFNQMYLNGGLDNFITKGIKDVERINASGNQLVEENEKMM